MGTPPCGRRIDSVPGFRRFRASAIRSHTCMEHREPRNPGTANFITQTPMTKPTPIKFPELIRRFVPPPGLERSRPREVRLTATGKALIIVAVILFAGAVAAGAGMQHIAQRQLDARRAMAEHGQVVTSK